MEPIYEQLKDLHIRNFVVYGKAADSKLYYESTYKTQVKQADLEDAFKKGSLLILDSTTYRVPVELAANVVKTMGTVSSALAFVSWSALATPAT